MPDGVVVVWDDFPSDPTSGSAWSIQSRYVRENTRLDRAGTILSRELTAILRSGEKGTLSFDIEIGEGKVGSTALTDVDKKGSGSRSVFDASGVLLYTDRIRPDGKVVHFSPGGNMLTQKEVDDIHANAVDEGADAIMQEVAS